MRFASHTNRCGSKVSPSVTYGFVLTLYFQQVRGHQRAPSDSKEFHEVTKRDALRLLEHDVEDQSEQQSETENVQEEPPVENTTRKPPPITFDSGQMLSNMLRMVGFDTRKIGALALNALIMVAQAVSSYHSQSCFNHNPLMFFFSDW